MSTRISSGVWYRFSRYNFRDICQDLISFLDVVVGLTQRRVNYYRINFQYQNTFYHQVCAIYYILKMALHVSEQMGVSF